MSGSEYHAEELKKREEKKESRKEQHIKSEKLLTLGNKITENDLATKIAKCVKWIEKLHEIRVVVSGGESDMQKTEKIVAKIEEEAVKVGGRILQKRTKVGEIRFSIMPTIKKEPTEAQSKPAANKKLLEHDTLEVQQVRSIHTMGFWQLSHLSHHHQLQQIANGAMSTKSSKCGDETKKRVTVTAVVGILLLAKYGFWSYLYSTLTTR